MYPRNKSIIKKKVKETSGAVVKVECEVKQNFLFKMRKVIIYLCAIGKELVQKKNLMT